jgi:hypothetical protein
VIKKRTHISTNLNKFICKTRQKKIRKLYKNKEKLGSNFMALAKLRAVFEQNI